MTIKQLKSLIENLPDEMEIVLQKDSEGNGYSPLSGADHDAVYIPDTILTTSIGQQKRQECQMKNGKKQKKRPRALILHPVN